MSATIPTIPEHLIQLFEDLDFVATVEPHHKPCLKARIYVDRDSWWGSIRRYMDGESGSQTAEFIRRVVERLCQSIDTYRDSRFNELLLSKALELRVGIVRLINTYNKSPDALGRLRTSLLVLDLKIPDPIKSRHGIIHHDGSVGISPSIQNDDAYDHYANDSSE